MIQERTTKYTVAVQDYLSQVGHATNQQILAHLQHIQPDLSATTVHRITARMVERGELAVAPVAVDHAMRFDSNTAPHDHFQCANCDRLRDVELPPDLFSEMQKLMGDCTISGRLTIRGSCNKCLQHTEEL